MMSVIKPTAENWDDDFEFLQSSSVSTSRARRHHDKDVSNSRLSIASSHFSDWDAVRSDDGHVARDWPLQSGIEVESPPSTPIAIKAGLRLSESWDDTVHTGEDVTVTNASAETHLERPVSRGVDFQFGVSSTAQSWPISPGGVPVHAGEDDDTANISGVSRGINLQLAVPNQSIDAPEIDSDSDCEWPPRLQSIGNDDSGYDEDLTITPHRKPEMSRKRLPSAPTSSQPSSSIHIAPSELISPLPPTRRTSTVLLNRIGSLKKKWAARGGKGRVDSESAYATRFPHLEGDEEVLSGRRASYSFVRTELGDEMEKAPNRVLTAMRRVSFSKRHRRTKSGVSLMGLAEGVRDVEFQASTSDPQSQDLSRSEPGTPRRDSLSDLKIPARISRAQVGLRRDLGIVREFSERVEQLKGLQQAHHELVLKIAARGQSPRSSSTSVFRHTRARSNTDPISRNASSEHELRLSALRALTAKYASSWESAALLIELGNGPPPTPSSDPGRPRSEMGMTSPPSPSPLGISSNLTWPASTGGDLSQRQLGLLKEMLSAPKTPPIRIQDHAGPSEDIGVETTDEEGEGRSKAGSGLRGLVRSMIRSHSDTFPAVLSSPLPSEVAATPGIRIHAPSQVSSPASPSPRSSRRPSLASIFRIGQRHEKTTPPPGSRSRTASSRSSMSSSLLLEIQAKDAADAFSTGHESVEPVPPPTELKQQVQLSNGPQSGTMLTLTPENIRPLLENTREVLVQLEECVTALRVLLVQGARAGI